jgi:hypothetical protein
MPKPDPTVHAMTAGLLAWLLPGAGHWWLGRRTLGGVYFGAITLAYFLGLLIGGLKSSIDPHGNVWLFVAEMGIGGYTTLGYLAARAIPTFPPNEFSPHVSFYPENDVAQIYLSVAGLLNVLAVLDAIARAQTGGLAVFHYETLMKPKPEASGPPPSGA